MLSDPELIALAERAFPDQIAHDYDPGVGIERHPHGQITVNNGPLRYAFMAGYKQALIQAGRDERKEGWVLVPVEPTREMAESGIESLERTSGCDMAHADAELCYRAMLSAAPAPEGDGA